MSTALPVKKSKAGCVVSVPVNVTNEPSVKVAEPIRATVWPAMDVVFNVHRYVLRLTTKDVLPKGWVNKTKRDFEVHCRQLEPAPNGKPAELRIERGGTFRCDTANGPIRFEPLVTGYNSPPLVFQGDRISAINSDQADMWLVEI